MTWRAAAWVFATALPAEATDLTALTAPERAAFRAELRALLLAEPEIVARALEGGAPESAAMAAEAQADRALLTRIAPDILAGHDVALFVATDCAECGGAIEDLTALSKETGARFILHDMTGELARSWAKALDLDAAPFYVLPDMVLRGRMPPVVLEKYLSR